MGIVADAALAEGGEVIGVIPEALSDLELSHKGLSELHLTSSMHERKAMMADLSDAFIALPGGIGTLEETFEILTWSQLGIHSKPVGLMNVENYFDGLQQFLDHTVTEGFVKPVHRQILISESESDKLIERLIASQVPKIKKWIDR